MIDHMERVSTLRAAMQAAELSAILLSDRKNIYYYSGFAGDDSLLLVGERGLFLLSDGRFIAQAAEEAPQAKMLCRAAGEGLADLLIKALTREPLTYPKLGFEGEHMRYGAWERLNQALAAHFPEISMVDCTALPLKPRLIKEPEEIAALSRCGEIEDAALSSLIPQLKIGMTEREIAWRLEMALRAAGADGLSFPTIAAGGKNSAKPHAIPSDYALQSGDFLTLDFGALYQGYCGDCTRTLCFGEPTEQMRAAYETVLAAQELGVAQILPDMTCAAADSLVREPIEAAGLGAYFSHSLGHGTGLNIHEAPTLSSAAKGKLQVGNVVTVEPGVYLPGEFGLRIEDSCLVTKDGLEPLTHFDKKLICL